MRPLGVLASYYQQFDADHSLDVPGEGYGGWKKAEIELDLDHTAVVVMHAWDPGPQGEFPGVFRAVEYNPRAVVIARTVFPRLLSGLRRAGVRLYHVVGGGDYYKAYPGYRRAVKLAGKAPPVPRVAGDALLERLKAFRADNVFPGKHNALDFDRLAKRLDCLPEARPEGDEGAAEDSRQLFALCRADGVNHLIYSGFAIDWCLLMSPGGMVDMSGHGVMCSVFRQAVTAVENRETARREFAKEIGLWRVALDFGFVFDVEDFLAALAPKGVRAPDPKP